MEAAAAKNICVIGMVEITGLISAKRVLPNHK
jgi:hypothetical protein